MKKKFLHQYIFLNKKSNTQNQLYQSESSHSILPRPYKDKPVRQTERGPSQPVAPQMLHEGREREGRCLDGRRGGVLQAAPATRCTRAAAADARTWVRPLPAVPYRLFEILDTTLSHDTCYNWTRYLLHLDTILVTID